MVRSVFLALAVCVGCGGATRAPATAADGAAITCLRMDEQAGVAPTVRRLCWQRATTEDAAAEPSGASEHAATRVRALSGATTEGTIADTPAGWGRAPTPPGTLPPPPPAPPPPPTSPCVARARTCDAECNGSSVWAECLDRCDRTLGTCLGFRAGR